MDSLRLQKHSPENQTILSQKLGDKGVRRSLIPRSSEVRGLKVDILDYCVAVRLFVELKVYLPDRNDQSSNSNLERWNYKMPRAKTSQALIEPNL